MSPTGFHGYAAEVALFAVGPVVAITALVAARFCGVPSYPRRVAMFFAGILSLAELGVLVWIWIAF